MPKFSRRSVPQFFVAAALAGTAIGSSAEDGSNNRKPLPQQTSENAMQQHPFVGMWVTDDGRIRHELLSNGRYDEARGNRKSAYQGRYEVTETHIEYWDDTGFTADGDFVDGDTLHHAGMVLRRR